MWPNACTVGPVVESCAVAVDNTSADNTERTSVFIGFGFKLGNAQVQDKSGWSWGCDSAVDLDGRTVWIADAHRDD